MRNGSLLATPGNSDLTRSFISHLQIIHRAPSTHSPAALHLCKTNTKAWLVS
jgi:hypothetical protein